MKQIPHDGFAAALETLDEAGFEFTVVCSGPDALCPDWDWAIAA